MIKTPLVLHVWPGRWGLPSIDPGCLEVILYLQLAFPGLYSLVETADPDQSPSGPLPFLTHGPIVISPLPSIISYISTLSYALLVPSDCQNDYEIGPSTVNPNFDAGLTALQLSQRTAWRAYFEAQLRDLVTHSVFVLEPNSGFTYYVPRRIKQSYRPRLEAVGLWLIADEPEDRQKSRGAERHKVDTNEDKIKRTFGQAKMPTSADLALASRIMLHLHAPLPNTPLEDLLNRFYTSLVSYANCILLLTFPDSSSASSPSPPVLPPPHMSPFNVFKGSLCHLVGSHTSGIESEEAKRFRRYRWGWVTLSIAGAMGYIMTQGLPPVIRIERSPAESQEEEEEVQGEEDEELIEDMELDDMDM